ncbi:hypothetical protein K7X08_037297 [Anisodus acutangulus]|uniref:VQ domain-containing protein n=1 Tax=Anisodus acutangulus TaxID=402998 RepID=A0A9Q1MWV9_9SOLA|nr:hypothetical protein K7X08_037297 [Anisodus acutangulus]
MDKILSVHSKKAYKQPKNTKKKPVKVVYIANPMKVNTSAAEFRALVQQLTGQNAKYPTIESTVGIGGAVPDITERDKNDSSNKSNKKGFYYESQQQVVHPQLVPTNNYDRVYNTEAATTDNSDLSFEDYVGGGEEDYVPELLENPFAASNLWYD